MAATVRPDAGGLTGFVCRAGWAQRRLTCQLRMSFLAEGGRIGTDERPIAHLRFWKSLEVVAGSEEEQVSRRLFTKWAWGRVEATRRRPRSRRDGR